MREILFRGKRLNNGEWKFGSYSKQYECHEILLESCEGEYGFDHYGIDPSTLGQYTGMTDKNGKKIFEGDICLVKSPRGTYSYTMRVAWDSFFFNGWVRSLYATDEESTRHCEQEQFEQFTNYDAKRCEVIGNAYDNPELLDDEEDTK